MSGNRGYSYLKPDQKRLLYGAFLFVMIAYLMAKVGNDKCQRIAPSLINSVENTPARNAVSESCPILIAMVWKAPPMIQAVA